MGHSHPTTRNLIEQRREKYRPYKRALRHHDHESFEELWTMAAYDAPSIKMADDHDVDFGILFAICRQQQKAITELREELDAENWAATRKQGQVYEQTVLPHTILPITNPPGRNDRAYTEEWIVRVFYSKHSHMSTQAQ